MRGSQAGCSGVHSTLWTYLPLRVRVPPYARSHQFRPRIALVILALSSCALRAQSVATSPPQDPPIRAGVVVEDVAGSSEGQKAGLQPGDLIFAYSRNGASARIGSPFDWAKLDATQSSRGSLTLRGVRLTEEMIWTLESGNWGITAGPALAGDLDLSYHRCRAMVLTEKYVEALQCWPSVIKEVQTMDPRLFQITNAAWFPVWLIEQMLASMSRQRDWRETEEGVTKILEFAQFVGGTPGAARMLQGLGSVAEAHGTPQKAEAYYRRALASWDKVVPDSSEAARMYNMLASVEFDNGDLIKAGQDYSHALTILTKMTPGNDDTATALNGLGLVAVRLSEWAKAIDSYRSTLAIREKLSPGSLAVADVLFNLGEPLYHRGDLAEAEEYYSRALAIREKLSPGTDGVAACLHMLGIVTTDRGALPRAEEYLRRALQIYEALLPDSLDAARTINGLGVVSTLQGDVEKAIEYHRHALAIQTELAPRSADIVVSLGDLGNLASNTGDLNGAQSYYQQALAIQEAVTPGGPDLAQTLENLGLVAQHRGDTTGADEYFRQALAIRAKLPSDTLDSAKGLTNLAQLADARGDLASADDYYHKVLAIDEKFSPGSLTFAWALQTLGKLASRRLDYNSAEAYARQALAVYTKVAPNSSYLASCFNDLGNAASDRSDQQMAESFYKQALAIYRTVAPESTDTAAVLSNLGTLTLSRHDPNAADRYYHEALALSTKLSASGVYLANSLLGLGNIEWDRGHSAEAEKNYREGLKTIEALAPVSDTHIRLLNQLGLLLLRNGKVEDSAGYLARSLDGLENETAKLGGMPESRWAFRSRFIGYYTAYASALESLNRPEEAFHVVERARARELLSMLAERDLAFAKDVPSEIQNARRLNAAAYGRVEAELSKLDPIKHRNQREQLLSRLQELTSERAEITNRLRQLSPGFAALQYPQPLDLAGARKILDAGTALLTYDVGDEETTLFVVHPVGKDPGLSVVKLAVGDQKLRRQIEAFRRFILERRTSNDSAFRAAARGLYDELVKPAEALLTSDERLLIVPDSPLYSLPFSALLRTANQYLVEWKPLYTVVSATVYAELRKGRRAEQKPVELAAFGDPQYAGGGRVKTLAFAESATRSEARGLSLAPLPFSRAEVDGIASLYPERSRKYLGADATVEQAKSLGKDIRYVHFAVHGLVDDRLPLHSALAFSSPGKTTSGKENGLLEAWEIFEHIRLDADLVTLSACNSGLGQERPGEGLIGLTRAFQYAGARSVLASLWSVDDLRTMELMKQFYTGLRSGKSKDEALRLAQIHLLHSAPSSSPFYWAAFTLSGDWR